MWAIFLLKCAQFINDNSNEDAENVFIIAKGEEMQEKVSNGEKLALIIKKIKILRLHK